MDRSDAVVVTGGRGRIGHLLVQDLRQRGRRVVSLARSHDGQTHPDDVAVDLTDADAVRTAVSAADADVLVHLASVLRGDELEKTNDTIDRSVMSAVLSAGIPRIVHASSGAVYGVGVETARTESSPLETRSPYARSKHASEQVLASMVEAGDVSSVLSLRIFNVAGPAFPDSLVHRLLSADPSRPVSLVAPDRFVRDYIHQDDLIDVLRAAIDRPTPGARILNVGAGVPVSTRMLLTAFGTDPSSVVEGAGGVNSNWADISQLVGLLGVRPRAVPDRTWA